MRGGETEGKEGTRRRGSKAEAKTDTATTTRVAEKANISSVGNNRACFDGRSRKNKYSNNKGTETRDGSGL